MARWVASDIPDQSGRVAIVTGANSGLGYVTARELSRNGARVVMACRDRTRGENALARLTAEVPAGNVELRELDLASLDSVRTFAEGIRSSYGALDLLVNNAGVMAIPRRESVDGFEMQLATNHLGHFALTGRLLPMLLDQKGARVVTVSSMGHRIGRLNFDDLMHTHSYHRWRVYGDTKLANLLFAFELQRRLSNIKTPLISVAAHPGTAATNLFPASVGEGRIRTKIASLGTRLVAQSDERGALPQLFAATAGDVQGGNYFGPSGIGEQRGYPNRVDSTSASKEPEAAARLWTLSEDLTGVRYDELLP